MPWISIDKAGSKLSEIETRPHNQLQSVEQADDTLGDSIAGKHVTNLQVKNYGAHVRNISGNPHGTFHNTLDGITQADDTSTDSTAGKHTTNAQLKVYKDHTMLTTVHHVAMAAQVNSVAATLPALVTDFNALLAKLRATGRLTP